MRLDRGWAASSATASSVERARKIFIRAEWSGKSSGRRSIVVVVVVDVVLARQVMNVYQHHTT